MLDARRKRSKAALEEGCRKQTVMCVDFHWLLLLICYYKKEIPFGRYLFKIYFSLTFCPLYFFCDLPFSFLIAVKMLFSVEQGYSSFMLMIQNMGICLPLNHGSSLVNLLHI